ncbi:unnamed protein product [Notodromas monacha]|uniref:Secreted protein n=1 Tax=Notodromas monacha TaxID=399045 RepID=A0A7R9GG47_9CRUS|nr:unnamed protein product [Notodromas monacha]CAG0920004.1 unnamed protein product [Notodromas monacha]
MIATLIILVCVPKPSLWEHLIAILIVAPSRHLVCRIVVNQAQGPDSFLCLYCPAGVPGQGCYPGHAACGLVSFTNNTRKGLIRFKQFRVRQQKNNILRRTSQPLYEALCRKLRSDLRVDF